MFVKVVSLFVKVVPLFVMSTPFTVTLKNHEFVPVAVSFNAEPHT